MTKTIGCIAGALACLGLMGAAPAAQDDSAAQAQKVLNRALAQMAQVREGSVEIESSTTSTRLEDGRQTVFWNRDRLFVREPQLFWNEELSGSGWSTVRWSDGKILRTFRANGSHADNTEMAGRKISERELIEGDYSKMLAGQKFTQLSPMRDAIQRISRAIAMTTPDGYRYLGTRQRDGETCDVIEMSKDGADPERWGKTRAQFPRAPEKETYTYILYLRASDGFPMHLESMEWAFGVVNQETIAMSRNHSRVDYRYGPAKPAADFDVERFYAAARGMASGKMPQIEQHMNKWQGKPLPEIAMVSLDGKPARFSDFKGKVLVIETWFIGCVYCKQAMPFYDKLRRQLKDQNVEFIALNIGAPKTDSVKQIQGELKKSRNTFGFHWLRATESSESISGKLLTLKGAAPDFFVVDAGGNFVMGYEGYGYGEGSEDPRLVHALKKAGITF